MEQVLTKIRHFGNKQLNFLNNYQDQVAVIFYADKRKECTGIVIKSFVPVTFASPTKKL